MVKINKSSGSAYKPTGVPMFLIVALTAFSLLHVVVSQKARVDQRTMDRMEKYIRSLTDEEKMTLETNGTCVKQDHSSSEHKDQCTYEIHRGAEYTPSTDGTEGVTKFCLKFTGFRAKDEACFKVACFDLKESVTFWVIVVGLPIALFVAVITLIWLCTHYAYYMCCCFIFHIKVPARFNKGIEPASNKVAPSSQASTVTLSSKLPTAVPASSGPASSGPTSSGPATSGTATSEPASSSKRRSSAREKETEGGDKDKTEVKKEQEQVDKDEILTEKKKKGGKKGAKKG